MIKFITFFLFLNFSSATFADYKRSIITDPSMARNCRYLEGKRAEKTKIKNSLQALKLRNERLIASAPANEKTAISKLRSTLDHIQNELRIAKLKINKIEERLVRQGCPGINL